MNPHLIEVFQRAYDEKLMHDDKIQHIWGMYTLDAVSVAIARVMRGDKNAKYMSKPLLEDIIKDSHLTEEEIYERELKRELAFIDSITVNDKE